MPRAFLLRTSPVLVPAVLSKPESSGLPTSTPRLSRRPRQCILSALTVSFPALKVAIATGEVVGTGSDGRRIYVVAFSDTFCRRHGEWLAVHAQETLALPPSQRTQAQPALSNLRC
jgi:hypothetical protein